jgi:hypothetical protein
MNTWRKEFVRDEYKKIHDKLETGVLMGEPVNMDSLEELVLCAYIAGKQEADHEAYKSISFFQEMLGLKNRIK